MSRYAVSFTKSADGALRKLPTTVQKRIAAAADKLQVNPRPPGCAKLQGEDDLWRIRVGDYGMVQMQCFAGYNGLERELRNAFAWNVQEVVVFLRFAPLSPRNSLRARVSGNAF